MTKINTDVLIIGAGPAGVIAAASLQQAGFKVHIVEKATFPRFIIGESLLPRSMEHFEAVGLLEILQKQGYEQKFGARFIRGHEQCFFDFKDKFGAGWNWTWQVPRAHFDKILADEVTRRGVVIHYNKMVKNIEFSGSNSQTTIEDKTGQNQVIQAQFIIDASGFGRVIPKLLNLDTSSSTLPRQAVFAHLQDPRRPEGKQGSVITFVIHRRDLWVWAIPFSDGTCSLGFVGNEALFKEYKSLGTLESQLRTMVSEVPFISERFEGADFTVPPMQMQAWGISVEKNFGEGYVITGNSSDFIDPVFSSGVTFATESGLLAAQLVARALCGKAIDWQVEYANQIKKGVDVFRTYVNAWYQGSLQDIFFFTSRNNLLKENSNLKNIRRQICAILAGYVWDETNPYVKRHAKAIDSLSKIIKIY